MLVLIAMLYVLIPMLMSLCRNAVIVMDCCYAGGLLENIRQSKWKNSFNVYTLAASKRNEKTLHFADLGPSLFTFFMACYLERNATLGKLPIRSSMGYCKALCPAFARLVYMTDKQKVKLKAERKSTIPNPIYDVRTVMHCLRESLLIGTLLCTCVCVCVCVRERER